ncbi:uncharacterized protein LOC103715912 isoform X2 [Phoenix dactylifera]|uniref:Uncharacterized protein LOC103715912 isoform X2 n=1 Tax=Phoenix dactylifera TaxID=42345 RepID=A0A8B9AIP2_PHODC|nr:uncharacterized protein LOC103715912 isoform X2 [Phoenix dactylifera]
MRNLLVFRKTRLEREQYDESIGRCALRGRIRQMAMRDIVIGTTAAASSSKPPPFLDPLPPKARLQRGSGAHSFKYKQIHNHSSRSHLQHTWDGLPQWLLSIFMHFLVDSSYAAIPFCPAKLQLLGMSEGDEHRMRDFNFIMERSLWTKVMKISTYKLVINLSMDKLL